MLILQCFSSVMRVGGVFLFLVSVTTGFLSMHFILTTLVVVRQELCDHPFIYFFFFYKACFMV
jgi:hypothetical protein